MIFYFYVMGRLLISDFDKFLYGEELVSRINTFYDKVEEIEKGSKLSFDNSEHLSDLFGLLLEPNKPKGVEFYDESKLPDYIMESVFEVFKQIVLGQ